MKYHQCLNILGYLLLGPIQLSLFYKFNVSPEDFVVSRLVFGAVDMHRKKIVMFLCPNFPMIKVLILFNFWLADAYILI